MGKLGFPRQTSQIMYVIHNPYLRNRLLIITTEVMHSNFNIMYLIKSMTRSTLFLSANSIIKRYHSAPTSPFSTLVSAFIDPSISNLCSPDRSPVFHRLFHLSSLLQSPDISPIPRISALLSILPRCQPR
jgi:hypothetical protein